MKTTFQNDHPLSRAVLPKATSIIVTVTCALLFIGLNLQAMTMVPVQLVNHSDDWYYHKGTNEPAADWQTVEDTSLDSSWLTGPGGFGYGDSDDATILSDMFDNYVTVYTRQTFEIASGVDTNLHLQLVINWDDAFIAYIDGVEVARSSNLPVIPPDGFHPYNQDLDSLPGAGPHREAVSAQTFDLGGVLDSLDTGTHILAVLGINSDPLSSDFSLIADLFLDLPIEDLVWTPAMGIIEVNSDIFIPSGSSLTVEAGTEIHMAAGVSVRTDGGSITILGTRDLPVVVIPSLPGQGWDQFSATGTGSSMTIQHADFSGGRIRFLNSSTGLMEDTYVHDNPMNTPIVYSQDAISVTLRRCHVERYFETLFQRTLMLIEDSLFESPRGDAVDFDGPPVGSIIRQCSFRNGPGGNTDAVDIGPSSPTPMPVGVLIEDCVMNGFTDKGVSIGEIGEAFSNGIVVRNCLMFNVGKGVQVKDTTVTTIYNCTIVDSEIGIHGFEKTASRPGGGITTNYNNILFNNLSAITIEEPPLSIIFVDHSNTQGTNWPGDGNINTDPLFLDALDRDYRLRAGSPCIGTGRGGQDMGITYPVGGAPIGPENLNVSELSSTSAALTWNELSDNESGFSIEISTNLTAWVVATNTLADTTGITVSGLMEGQAHFFRVRATNILQRSLSSNVASLGGTVDDLDGDGMPNDWETGFGLNPNDARDAVEDTDGDGADNLHEFRAGTDPRDSSSKLAFSSVQLTGLNTITLEFEAQSDRTYQVQFKNNMEDENWQILSIISADPASRVISEEDNILPIFKSRFYRLMTP